MLLAYIFQIILQPFKLLVRSGVSVHYDVGVDTDECASFGKEGEIVEIEQLQTAAVVADEFLISDTFKKFCHTSSVYVQLLLIVRIVHKVASVEHQVGFDGVYLLYRSL